MISVRGYVEAIKRCTPMIRTGSIEKVVGMIIESNGPPSSVGDACEIGRGDGGKMVPAEVVGFKGSKVLLMPLAPIEGIKVGDLVRLTEEDFTVPVGENLCGRVVDGMGRPIDGRGPLVAVERYPIRNKPPGPLERENISEPLWTGVRSIDGLLTVGRGQRIGIFSGSGVGKSTLLGMLSRNSTAEINVIALIGERGREVRPFLEVCLGVEGIKRSVVVVSTSDEPPLVRIKGAFTATAIAEYFRDQGKDVMLMMDSSTRLAMAQRELGLAVGEIPSARGYTPSVFSLLPLLLERAGAVKTGGSITAFYTVLVEGDDLNDPVADSMRAILDGHICLSRRMAGRGLYPSIDLIESVSRLMPDIVSEIQFERALRVRELVAAYLDAEELIKIGAYKEGNDPLVDRAIARKKGIDDFIRQGVNERIGYEDTLEQLSFILGES